MVDITAASNELTEVSTQIEWINQELSKNISPKQATELRARLQIEQKRLNNFEQKYKINF